MARERCRGVHKEGADAPHCPEMSHEPGDTSEIPILASADALEAVPGYTLIRFLGEGSLARAYECRAERTGEIVVVKVFKRHTSEDSGNVQRVLRENRVVAGLRSHRHIARVLDVGESPAGPYVVFERLRGTDLRARLVNQGRMAVPDALVAVRDAARALEAAAAAGVIHRNLKPSNLFLLEDGSVKLTDFGFAASLGRLGGPDNVYGTPAFVAPELLRSAAPDSRTDAYALGATLFQLVTARPLFEGATADVLAAHEKKPVPSIATMVPDAGIVVVDILYRLLQKDPARRPASAGEVVKALDEAVARASRNRTAPPAAVEVDTEGPTRVNAAFVMPKEAPGGGARRESPSTTPPSPFDESIEGSDPPYVGQPTGVMGTLKQMSVTEIIQMLEIGKKSARIDLTTDGLKGTLHVHDGQVVHATANAQTGEAAVVAMCRKKEGFFRIHYEKEPCERNVHRPTTFVLLEAMRQIDETDPATSPATSAANGPAEEATAPLPTRPAEGLPRRGTQPPRRLPPLARPLSASPPLADDAEANDATKDQLTPLDDPTLPEIASRANRAGTFFDELVAQARRVAVEAAPHLRRAARRVSEAATQLAASTDDALEPLRPHLEKVHPGLADTRPVVVVGVGVAVVLALTLGLATAMTSGGASAATREVLAGDARDVIEELEEVPPAERTLADDLALANAWAAVLEDERALELYENTVPAGVGDALALGFLLSRLDASTPDDEIDLLVLWPDESVDDELAALVLDPRRFVRANAVTVLVERGTVGRIDVEALAAIEVQDGAGDEAKDASCGARRTALQVLRVAGKSARSLAVVEQAGASRDSCFSQGELRAVAAAIQKRLEPER